MFVNLKYGREVLKVQIRTKGSVKILKPKELQSLKDIDQSIKELLHRPTGTEPLHKLVERGSRVALLVSDVTRPCPTSMILPSLILELRNAGVEKEDITIFFANGLHRPQTAQEAEAILGRDFLGQVKTVNHDGRDSSRLSDCGRTRRGTRLQVNSQVLDCDFRIGIANIDVHYFAGYSGGGKSILPGVCGEETITRNHSLMLEPTSKSGVADGNPVRMDIEEAAGKAGLHFIVNPVLNEKREIVDLAVGDFVNAHRKGVETNDMMYKVKTGRLADIVLASVGGYPKDLNLYQAQKGLDNAFLSVREGGTVILLAECPEGLGDETFRDWLTSAEAPDDVIARLKLGFVLGGHKAYAIARLAKKANTILVSKLKPLEIKSAFARPAATADEALRMAFEDHGVDAEVTVMPYAGSTLPTL